MSGASGVQTKLTSKWARALLFTMDRVFGHVSYENSSTSCEVCISGREVFAEKCTAKDKLKLRYSDSTGYLQVIISGGETKTIAKNIVKELCVFCEALQGGEEPRVPSELVEDIAVELPLDGENPWWDEIRALGGVAKSRGAAARAKATAATSAMLTGSTEYGSTGNSATTGEAMDPAEQEAVTQLAFNTWEYLAEFPDLRQRVLGDLRRAGAKVKVGQDTITKEESQGPGGSSNDF